MSFCLTASRLMKASEVRKLCAELRNDPAILVLEMELKKEWYKRKMASAPTLAIAHK
ncbi:MULTISPECIES: hypothetical protein [Anoxybacillus]|uniref:Uncharacterized protein n=1 Tax=Anoxybacillus flavithermus TaxID=33934 RepID=A0A178TDS3_9BACL|nr:MULTISPECIES: hypothetical protein [Anoxybacillus]MBE2912688.1 hypothetical protein [Anoxybacillus flavithermus]MCZ0754338.1 hypothetical protein [Anoxybacillus sp. J5B_2022]OAO79848.1 hypothetical protein TAF16_1359 [Anoxybacillus flavithermus]